MKNRILKKLLVSNDNLVHLRFSGSTHFLQAKALEHHYDENGGLIYLLLDRLVHSIDDSFFEFEDSGFNVSGCYVSLLSR